MDAYSVRKLETAYLCRDGTANVPSWWWFPDYLHVNVNTKTSVIYVLYKHMRVPVLHTCTLELDYHINHGTDNNNKT